MIKTSPRAEGFFLTNRLFKERIGPIPEPRKQLSSTRMTLQSLTRPTARHQLRAGLITAAPNDMQHPCWRCFMLWRGACKWRGACDSVCPICIHHPHVHVHVHVVCLLAGNALMRMIRHEVCVCLLQTRPMCRHVCRDIMRGALRGRGNIHAPRGDPM